jgi:hypothetical protein|nr:MAG TPA: hypothetical protein [Bacteriophage sp.]
MMPEYTGQCNSLSDKFKKQNHMHSKHFRVGRKCLLCFFVLFYHYPVEKIS